MLRYTKDVYQIHKKFEMYNLLSEWETVEMILIFFEIGLEMDGD